MNRTHSYQHITSVGMSTMNRTHSCQHTTLPGKVSRMNRTHSVNMHIRLWACGPSAAIQGRSTERSSVSCCIQAAVGSFRLLVQYGVSHGENISVSTGHNCSHTATCSSIQLQNPTFAPHPRHFLSLMEKHISFMFIQVCNGLHNRQYISYPTEQLPVSQGLWSIK